MTCEKAINEYCKLDKNQSLPVALSIHMMFCPKCRTLIQNMERLDKFKELDGLPKIKEDSILKVMNKINALETKELEGNKKPVLIPFFIVIALFMLPFIILPMLDIGKILIDSLGLFFVLPLGLLSASITCIISAIFVIKNTKYLTKRFLH